VIARRVTLTLLLLACLSLGSTRAQAYSYAGVMAGITTPTGLSTYRDAEADRVSPGSFGTTILFEGLFPLVGTLSFSPSFGFLSTDGEVEVDRLPSSAYDVFFRQSELGCDLLWKPEGFRRFRVGPGVSAAWWNAVEDHGRPIDARDQILERQVVRGQSVLIRGVAHLLLRNPEVSGATMKLIAAMPLTEALRIEDSAAAGYVGLSIGFSMILN